MSTSDRIPERFQDLFGEIDNLTLPSRTKRIFRFYLGETGRPTGDQPGEMNAAVEKLHRRAVRHALELAIRAMLEIHGGPEPEEDEPEGLQEIRRLERLAELYRAGLIEIASLPRDATAEQVKEPDPKKIARSYLRDAEREFDVESGMDICNSDEGQG